MIVKILIVNIITLLRIIGTLILIPFYNVYGGFKAGLFSLGCYFTDTLDGILARKWKVSTFFGSMFDGIADKLLTIINFVILYLITPYAIIPIIFEILTVLLQFFKFNKNYNIKSNIIGKIKIWLLALSLVILFIVSDITSATFIPLHLRELILSVPANSLYFWILFPTIIMELLTFISYIVEIFKPSKKVIELDNKKIDRSKYKNNTKKEYFKEIWFNPEFYSEHKNNTNLKDLWNLTKTK